MREREITNLLMDFVSEAERGGKAGCVWEPSPTGALSSSYRCEQS